MTAQVCRRARRAALALMSLGLFGLGGSCQRDRAEVGHVLDEARRAGRAAASFPAADEDYFREMDGGLALAPEEVRGRDTWIVWTGGNDRFWDRISRVSLGALDFLKTLSSHPKLRYSRDTRWVYLGLVKHDLAALPRGASDAEAKRVFANLVDPLLTLSRCPDFVVNRGHYFGTDRFRDEPGLGDDDKRALIEFLKTF